MEELENKLAMELRLEEMERKRLEQERREREQLIVY